jgi:hypothetical protein
VELLQDTACERLVGSTHQLDVETGRREIANRQPSDHSPQILLNSAYGGVTVLAM